MSNEKSQNEIEQKVVISADEVNSALDFWRHFNIPITEDLQKAFEDFQKEATFQNQQKIKLAITQAISTSTHEAFLDEMFSKIREECSDVAFQMQFDKDLEETVTVPE